MLQHIHVRSPIVLLFSMVLLGALFFGATRLGQRNAASGNALPHPELALHSRLAEVRSAPGIELTPFVTDGCSGGMSSLWMLTAERFPAFAEIHDGVPPWESCCVTHDQAYHAGGAGPNPEASFSARIAADEELRRCVVATSRERSDVLQQVYGLDATDIDHLYEAIGSAMFHAVRLGGQPCTGLPWRWGYGYPSCGVLSTD
jgi:hypothetical protein